VRLAHGSSRQSASRVAEVGDRIQPVREESKSFLDIETSRGEAETAGEENTKG
jgi:hypothetical protein